MIPSAQGDVTASDGVRLHWRRWNPPGAVRGLVWVVHGLGEHGGRYDLVAEAATRWGFVVFAHDHRGHGLSEGTRTYIAKFQDFLDDLGAVRATAEDGIPQNARRIVWGHSLGGLIAIRALQANPGLADAAIFSAPWLADATAQPRWREGLARLLDHLCPRVRLSAGLGPDALTADPERRDAWRADPLVQTSITPRLYFEAKAAQREVWSDLDRLFMPSLFLVPTNDTLVSAAETLRFASSVGPGPVRIERLAGARHEPHNDVGRRATFELVRVWIEDSRGDTDSM